MPVTTCSSAEMVFRRKMAEAREQRDAENVKRAKQHDRDPRVRLCRKERKRKIKRDAKLIAEARGMYERLQADLCALGRGGRPRKDGKKARGPSIHVPSRKERAS